MIIIGLLLAINFLATQIPNIVVFDLVAKLDNIKFDIKVGYYATNVNLFKIRVKTNNDRNSVPGNCKVEALEVHYQGQVLLSSNDLGSIPFPEVVHT